MTEEEHLALHQRVENDIIDLLDDAFDNMECGAAALAKLLCMYLRDDLTDPDHAAQIVVSMIAALPEVGFPFDLADMPVAGNA